VQNILFTVDLLILRLAGAFFWIFALPLIFNGTVHDQQCH
jgi:hypothetical protein